MKKKYILLAAIILLISKPAFPADFLPEAEFNPFSSELNPEYIDKNKFTENEFELKKFIKEKLQERRNKKEEAKNLKAAKRAAEKEAAAKRAAEKAAQESFIAKPKKELTNAELERELEKEEKEKQKELLKAKEKEEKLTLIEKIFNIKTDRGEAKREKDKWAEEAPAAPNINISADLMEYFPDIYEIHAKGNAKAEFQAQDTKIYADKIIFDYDRNILKAHGNVVLVSRDSTTEGDFLRIDLTKPQGWMENPVTKTEDIQISSKEAFIYSDKIEEFNGSGKILKDEIIDLGGRSFASYIDQSGIFETAKGRNKRLSRESKGIYKIKAKTVVIDSKDEHEIITIKNAGVYLKNHKIAVIPSAKIVTNKAHTNVETNIPEIGSTSQLGFHAGPAVVLNTPRGTTLKLAPILTYGDSKFGIGAIARFSSVNHMTEAAYSTSKKHLVLKGRHDFTPGLSFNYGHYANFSEWFLGYRMPKYAADFTYNRTDYIKDLKLGFSQMYSAGLYVDNKDGYNLHNIHARYRWMTQTYKPIFTYRNKETDGGLRIGLIAQTAATVYSQGDVTGLFRIGPVLTTQIGRWQQSLAYYQTAQAGESPFEFDRYRYGKSNITLIESFKVNKYLTLGYLASISLHNKYRHDGIHDDSLFQENRFMASIGPEYAKLIIGYDAIRHSAMMQVSMLVGTKNSDIEFKKTIINNPEKFGHENNKKEKPKKKSYKKYKKEIKEEMKKEADLSV